MLRMEEYYWILHFLKSESMDRMYPVEDYFYETDEEGNRTPIIYEGDSFLFTTNRNSFNGIDYIEVLLESNTEYCTEDLSLNLSQYPQGYDPLVVFTPDLKRLIPIDTPIRVVFTIRKSMTMSEASRNYTNIHSLELVTPNNQDFKIHEICFRQNNAQFALDQLDKFYEDGKYHITSQLHMDEVPEELINQSYKASAGYGWMSIWEYEARVMNDEQKNAMSYGKWLLAQVDKAIDAYKKAHGIADDEDKFVKDDIVTSVPLRF